jgi:hypothetical protein
MLINLGHGLQYQAVEDTAIPLLEGGNSIYNAINGYSYSNYPSANQGTPYLVYSVFYFVVNFCFFFIFNTGIEVKLVHRMHRELQDKRERLANMNAEKPSALVFSTDNLTQNQKALRDKTKDEEDAKKERKLIKMVILNGFFNLVLRAPDVLFWLENESVWSIFEDDDIEKVVKVGKSVPGLLSLVADIGFLTYILTFTTNFIIFDKFNKNFKEAVVFFRKTSKSKVNSRK